MSLIIDIRIASDCIPNIWDIPNIIPTTTNTPSRKRTRDDTKCTFCHRPDSECEYRYTKLDKMPMYLRVCQIPSLKE